MDELYVSGAKRMKKCRNHHRDWSGLPRNVLLCIMDKLIVIDDYVRFGGVCRRWRFTFVEEISNRPSSSHPPFLLIASPSPPPQHGLALYSLSRERVYDFSLQVPRNKVCRGSSFGWLVTVETTPLGGGGDGDCCIQLHNPFSNRIIHLPPLDSILQQHPEPGDINRPWYKYYLHKAVLSSDPTSSPHNFVIVAIMSKYFGLAFFKPGNTTWTSIEDDWYTHAFDDVIFFHNTNQFYAVLDSGAVFSIDFLGDHPKLTKIAPRISGPCRVLTYLVEDLSSGDLFQVLKNFETSTKVSRLKRLVKYGLKRARNVDKYGLKQSSSTTTVQFSVFKLDPIDRNWTQIHDLGQNVIFLGKNASMLRSTSDCPGCEPNSIYYTGDDDFTYFSNFENYGLPRDGIYNLKDGSVRPHYSSANSNVINFSSTSSKKILPKAIWIQPTLRHCN